jgi:hypothetical protein
VIDWAAAFNLDPRMPPVSQHRYPDGLRFAFAGATAILAAVTLLFAGLVVGVPWWQLRLLSLACGSLTGWGVMHGLGWTARVRETLSTTPRGLVVRSGATTRMIEWTQVAALRSRNVAAELRVLGAGGQILACIGYYLQGFDALRDEILANVRLPAATRFRSSRAPVAGVLAASMIPALLALGGMVDGDPQAWIPVIVWAALLYFCTTFWWTARIGPGGIEVRRLFRTVRVSFADVAAIALRNTVASGTQRNDQVCIVLRDGRSIDLGHAGHDTLALYASLNAAHRAYRLAAPPAAHAAIARP